MANILEHEGDLWHAYFRSQQIIMIVLQFCIRKMVPPVKTIVLSRNQQDERESYVLASPYKSAGAFTFCMPSLHRLH